MKAKVHPAPVLWRNLPQCIDGAERTLHTAMAARRAGFVGKATALLYYAGKHARTAKQIIAHLERVDPR